MRRRAAPFSRTAGLIAAGGLLAACAPGRATAPDPVVRASGTSPSAVVDVPREGLFLDGFFPIGVFSQPESSFATWKARGVNTVLETPQGHDAAAWDRAARRHGLRMIRRPAADPRQDIGRTDLLAWSHWDEPDASGRAPEWTPLFERTAAQWRAIDPQRRIFINFAGPDLTWFTSRTDAYSVQYASHYPRLIATADWIANDLYPAGGWLNEAHRSRRGDVTLIAEPLRVLRRMADKPLFAFVETSEVERGNVPGARCPTAPEVRAQIWIALAEGVRGLFYFPAVVGTGGFRFDGTPPEIVAEITRQNATITALAPLLQGQTAPAGLAAQAPPGVVVGWRRAGREILLIVVNARPSPMGRARIPLTGVGPDHAAARFPEGAPVTLDGGAYVDDLEAHGVRLIRFRPR